MEKWQKTPSEFWALPAVDRKLMLAWAHRRLSNLKKLIESSKQQKTDSSGVLAEVIDPDDIRAIKTLMVEFM